MDLVGRNMKDLVERLRHNAHVEFDKGCDEIEVCEGDTLQIETPGGGGFGNA